MIKACIVNNNIVENVILVKDETEAATHGAVYLGKYPNIGDKVVDGVIPGMAEREVELDNIGALAERNQLLSESDWTQLPDSPLTTEKKTEWATYRQQLRDMPAQEGFPGIDFPVMPS